MKFSNISRLLLAGAVLATSAFAGEQSGFIKIGEGREVKGLDIKLMPYADLSGVATADISGLVVGATLEANNSILAHGAAITVADGGRSYVTAGKVFENRGTINMTYAGEEPNEYPAGIFAPQDDEQKPYGEIKQVLNDLSQPLTITRNLRGENESWNVYEVYATWSNMGISKSAKTYMYQAVRDSKVYTNVDPCDSVDEWIAELSTKSFEEKQDAILGWQNATAHSPGRDWSTTPKQYMNDYTEQSKTLLGTTTEASGIININGIDTFAVSQQGALAMEDDNDYTEGSKPAGDAKYMFAFGNSIYPPIHTEIATIKVEDQNMSDAGIDNFASGFEIKTNNAFAFEGLKLPEHNDDAGLQSYLNKFGINLYKADQKTPSTIAYEEGLSHLDVLSATNLENQAFLITEESSGLTNGTILVDNDAKTTHEIKVNLHNINAGTNEYLPAPKFAGAATIKLTGKNRHLNAVQMYCPVEIARPESIPTNATFHKALKVSGTGEIQNGSEVTAADQVTVEENGSLKVQGQLVLSTVIPS